MSEEKVHVEPMIANENAGVSMALVGGHNDNVWISADDALQLANDMLLAAQQAIVNGCGECKSLDDRDHHAMPCLKCGKTPAERQVIKSQMRTDEERAQLLANLGHKP